MTKPRINNYEDLLEEKERLKEQLKESKANVKYAFDLIKEELNPVSAIKETALQAFKPDTTNPLVKFGIKRGTEFLIGKVLLRRAGWLPKLIVPFVVREVSTRLVGSKADKKIAKALHSAAAKIREVEVPDLGAERE